MRKKLARCLTFGLLVTLFGLFAGSCIPLGLDMNFEGTSIPSPLPPTLVQVSRQPDPTMTPTSSAPVEPAFLVWRDSRVSRIESDGRLATSWDAEGLNPAGTDWVQVVDDALYYLNENTGKIFLNREGSVVSLDFTGEDRIGGFVVSQDGSRLAWSVHTHGRDELWIANTNGLGRTLILEEPPDNALSEELRVEPVRWTSEGDLVFAWNFLGMGDNNWPGGYGSLYIFSPATGQVSALAALPEEPVASCWRGLTADALFLAGVCSSQTQTEQLEIMEVESQIQELVMRFEGQIRIGPVAFSRGQRQLAYVAFLRDGQEEASQVALRSFPGAEPAVLLTLDGEFIDHIEWLDEEQLVVQVRRQPVPAVLLLTVNGEQRQLAEGWFLGWVDESEAN